MIISSCKKVNVNDIQNLNGDFIYVIGHGGVGFQTLSTQLPENSMISIVKAIEVYGADGVEVDVQLSKDLQLVLYHDDQLETSTDGNGFVYEYNLMELNKFKYNRDIYANLFIDEHLVSLEEVLQKISAQKVKPQLHLDLRSWLYDNKVYTADEYFSIYSSKIVDLLKQYNYTENTYIASGDNNLLIHLYQLDPSLKLMIETGDIENAVKTVKDHNWYGIISYNESVTKTEVNYVHSKGIRMALFAIKTQQDQVEAVNKYPDFILTDNIPQLQQILYN
jgi:glycerophosphoryl diester phosphodiesterase